MSELVPPIVVMGVSGSGKSTIGQMLADALHREFIDGDSLHPDANRQKMAAGQALNDQDREPWLRVIGQKLTDGTAQGEPLVIACSALKRDYRDLIRSLEPATLFVHLAGVPNLIRDRMNARSHEYMPTSACSTVSWPLWNSQRQMKLCSLQTSQTLPKTSCVSSSLTSP